MQKPCVFLTGATGGMGVQGWAPLHDADEPRAYPKRVLELDVGE